MPVLLWWLLNVFLLANYNINCFTNDSIEDNFKQCIISTPLNTFGKCLGYSVLTKIKKWDNEPEFYLMDGITSIKEEREFRDSYNYGNEDSASFRGIIDSLGHVFSQRSLNWDMGFLYPGLEMHIAPSSSPGGQLEFVLDPRKEIFNKHSLKEVGTGHLLARQFLVPFLLGFKFNVATILPILFGILILLAKKAIIVSKIALIISSAYGLGSLLFRNGNRLGSTSSNYYFNHIGEEGNNFNPGLEHQYHRYPNEYSNVLYQRANGNNVDQLNLYANLQNIYDRDNNNNGRNFAWNEDEKEMKKSN